MTADRYIHQSRLDTESSGEFGEQGNTYATIGVLYAELISDDMVEKEYSAKDRTVYRIINGHDIKRTDRFTDKDTDETYEVLGTKRFDNDYTDYICERKDA